MKKLLNFIKYNNAFTIIISLVMFSTAGAFANEKVRDTVIGQTIVTKNGTDNTRIISADLDNFDMGLKINSVKEDDKFYYVNFDYNAIDAKDGVWQSVKKEKNVNVLKARLGDTDLGVYLSEELKQLTEREMAYMKEVQSIEKNKGLKKQTESVEYTGLKGLVFNNETKEITGYEPVKEEEKDKTIVIEAAALTIKAVENKEENKKTEEEKVVQQITVVKETVSKETIMEMVREALAQEQGNANSSSSSSDSLPTGQASSSSQSSSESVSSSPESSSSSSLPAGEAGSSAGEASSSSAESSSSEPTTVVSSESSSSSETSSSSEASSSQSLESSASSVGESSSSAESSSSVESSSSSSEVSSSANSSISSSESSSSLSASEASSPQFNNQLQRLY